MNVGFIGIGAMGAVMVQRLLAAGHAVRIWNRSPGPAQRLAQRGATVVATPAEACKGEAVFSMLADDVAARAVLLDSGMLQACAPGLVHVNMATISIGLAAEMARCHAEQGVDYVAAPVLGRPDVAAAGKLNILAAGAPAAIDRVQPLLDLLGQKTWHLGETAEHANVYKLAANFMLACAIETFGEAAALVDGHGAGAAQFHELITSTLFPGPVYTGYGKLITEGRYEPALFKARLGLKDVRLALAAGEAIHTPLPLGSVVRDSLIEAMAHGDGEKDFAVLGRVAQRRAGRQ